MLCTRPSATQRSWLNGDRTGAHWFWTNTKTQNLWRLLRFVRNNVKNSPTGRVWRLHSSVRNITCTVSNFHWEEMSKGALRHTIESVHKFRNQQYHTACEKPYAQRRNVPRSYVSISTRWKSPLLESLTDKLILFWNNMILEFKSAVATAPFIYF